jgi:hypothetical protein
MELIGQTGNINSKSIKNPGNMGSTNYKLVARSIKMIEPLNSVNNKLFEFSDEGDMTNCEMSPFCTESRR